MQLSIFEDEPTDEFTEAPARDFRAERNLARAAEFFVAYDVSRRGFDCFTVGEGLRYDLIVDVGGLRRVQVKSSRRASSRDYCGGRAGYQFGHHKVGSNLESYANQVDLFAFMAMDRLVVLYALPGSLRNSLWVSPSAMTIERSDLSWLECLRAWGIE
jgi:hypothetical protein